MKAAKVKLPRKPASTLPKEATTPLRAQLVLSQS